jgi:putative flavoprotein involved in K+ transport
MAEVVDTVVIGAGHVGLAISRLLTRDGTDHIVLERGQVAQRWRSERWDSLVFQFPNWSLQLPDYAYRGADPDGYASKDEFIRFLEEYAATIRAPLRRNTEVHVVRDAGNGRFLDIETSRGTFRANNVVVATGSFHTPKIPKFSENLSPDICQIHARDYRNPTQLPGGNIVVVGSGASGCQIAEELHRNNRKVFLAVGRFNRTPRRYRGRDFYWWFDKLGYWHTPLASMPTETRNLRFVVTAVDGGHDVDPRQYAVDGIVLAGHLKSADKHKLTFHDDVEATLDAADAWFEKFRKQMDECAATIDPPLPTEPTAPDARILRGVKGIVELDLREQNVRSVIWATGYALDFSWIKLPVFAGNGDPKHERGVTQRAGLYFLGLRRTYSIGSALVAGAEFDAAYVANHIAATRKLK